VKRARWVRVSFRCSKLNDGFPKGNRDQIKADQLCNRMWQRLASDYRFYALKQSVHIDLVGRQIARRIAGGETQPFKYSDKGVMATIGRGSAVVEFRNKQKLHGPLAYFAWLGVHLALLSGMRSRIETLWNWGWSALTHDRAARIIIDKEEETQGAAQSNAGVTTAAR